MKTMKTMKLAALSLFVGAGASSAATIYTNNFPNTTGIVVWNDGGTIFNIAGEVVNNALGGITPAAPGDTSGTMIYSNGLDFSILLGDDLAANTTYVLSIEFGDRTDLNNGNPALRLGFGSTPGASYLTPTVSLTPVTVHGGWVTWSLTYTTGAAPVGLGQDLRIDIVNQGTGIPGDLSNAQLVADNLKLTAADAIPEPSTALLGGLGMLALLRRRR
jgi:hypothetical protein